MVDRISSRPVTRNVTTPSSTPQATGQQPVAQARSTPPNRVGDGFGSASNAGQHWGTKAQSLGAVTGPAAKPKTQAPANLRSKVGTLEYYKARHDDFVRRNPGKTPPDYYLGYGDKYANRFLNETSPKLSKAGQEWLQKTFVALQSKIEDLRQKDPAAFARLEQDPEAFRKFAYGTHSDAYVESGLSKLPPGDLAKIALTPDFKDVLTKDGIAQMVETGLRVGKQWAGDAIDAGKSWASNKVKDAGNWIKNTWKSIF
ncbi:MAG TPA: hypothetical protein VNA24_00355 [Hyalangium sp.]|nr:hypothetical protein [Hyalangium sp.]